MAVHDRQQHGYPVGIQPLRHSPRRTNPHPADHRLHLYEQRAAALHGDGNDAAGSGLGGAREEDGGWVADLLQAALGHGEDPELIDRSKAVLRGSHDAKATASLALEVQHGVDEMLEHARACNRALLGDVADDDHRRAARLGKTDELCSTFPQLRYRTRAGVARVRFGGLDESTMSSVPLR